MSKLWILGFIAVTIGCSSQASADIGKVVFERKCIGCHSQDGTGNPYMARMLGTNQELMNLTSNRTQEKSANQIATVIRRGRNKMQSFAPNVINEKELQSVILYIRQLQKSHARQ